MIMLLLTIVIVQWLSCVQILVTPWTTAHQAPLSSTITHSLYSSHPLYMRMTLQNHFQWVTPSHQVGKVLEFQVSYQSFQWISQGWFPLGLTGLMSLLSKGLSSVFSNTTDQKHQFWWKKSKRTQTDGEIYHVHGLEESTVSKWPYYPKQSTDSMQSLSSYQQYFSQN